MLAISTFYPRILPYVPGASMPLVDQAITDSIIEFCEKSQIVREFIADQQTVANQDAYAIADQTYETVARILTVKINGESIAPLTTDIGAIVQRNTPGKPLAYYTTSDSSLLSLHLYPTPDASYTLSIEVAWKPQRTATQFEDLLYNFWVEPIVCGALGRLMLAPGQPFTDNAAGERNLMLASIGANKARTESISGRLVATRRVRHQPFA